MKAFLIKSQNTISFMCFPLLFGLLDHFLTWLLWLRYNFRSRFLAPIKKNSYVTNIYVQNITTLKLQMCIS
jgi:hypothetical protein